MSWLTGWQYRKALTIAPSADGAQAAYQMKLLVGQSCGISSAKVHCAGHVLSSFDDLRFTTADGVTLCPYWIEEITGSPPNLLAAVTINIPSIAASPDDTIIYMYYGNPDADPISSGADTFIIFEDADNSTGSPQDNGWTENDAIQGALAYSTTEAKYGSKSLKIAVAGVNYIVSRSWQAREKLRLTFWLKCGDLTPNTRILLPGSGISASLSYGYSGGAADLKYFNGSVYIDTGYDLTIGWDEYEITCDGATDIIAWLCNGVSIAANAVRTPFSSIAGLGCMISNANTLYFDAVRVSNYTPNEPSWSSFGPEELDPRTCHIILSADYSEESPGINRAFVAGFDPCGTQVTGSAIAQAEIDLVGERLEAYHNPAVRSPDMAAAVAAAMLEKARLDRRQAGIIIPPHCGLELWDVLAVVDSAANQDRLYRVAGYELEYDTGRGTFLHYLELCDV